jgi:hypothetical protein
MRNRRRHGNMTPQEVNNTIEDLMDSEGEETSVSKFKSMMIRCLRSLKRTYKNKYMNSKSMDKKLEKTQKQLNELKEDTNKH